MNDEKQQFSTRLADAMRAAGYEARPSVLENQFNSRYWGKPVTYQAARRWLIGLSIPEQDKLQVLSDWLDVDSHMLRFGNQPSRRVREKRGSSLDRLTTRDQDMLDAYLTLSLPRQKLVRDLIEELSTRGASNRGDA
ncbi:hypothetical protein LDO31_04035 [Luteimonas sp. XNQY3]|nr:hypothetical protein [Luteimonas sp. XNQY3]MCD9005417.1 hypothetical protein [Luteimonas sp. XNQY3]